MDKLKPILAQKFWILSGLCLFLPLFGWWWDSAAMSKEITDRTDKIKKAFDGVPPPGPNKQWSDQVELKNKEEDLKVAKTGEQLWEALVPYMVWPERMTDVVAKAGYQGVIDPTTRGEYRDLYEKEIVDLPEILSPFDPYTSKGMVQIQEGLILSEGLGFLEVAPSDKVTWDAQEDIWLYTALLEAVQRTNQRAGGDSLLNSVIKQIDVLILRGGSPKTPGGAGAAPAAQAPMGMGPMGGHMAMPAGPGGAGSGDAARGSAGGGAMTASFDPAEEFGSDEDTTGGAGGGNGAPPMGIPMGPPKTGGGGPMGGHSGPVGGSSSGLGSGDAPKKRYIEETKRYKTRGFYMEVVMDHRKLPEFLAELSDSPWPLKVVRVQQVDKDLQDVGSTTVGGAGMGGMGGMGGMAPSAKSMGGPAGGHAGGAPKTSAMQKPTMGRFPGADQEEKMQRRSSSGLNAAGVGGVPGEAGENIIDPTAVMSDPNLVNVAIAGIITLYLPPEVAAAVPGGAPTVPGAPVATGTTVAPAATGAALPAATGTTAPATNVPGTTAPTATGTSTAIPAGPTTGATAPAAGTGANPAPAEKAAGTEPTEVPAAATSTPAPSNAPAPTESKATEPAPAGATPAQTPPTTSAPGTEKK
jgi:hypothetical protein